jgi:Viral A-type inclusion protein repeat
VSGSRARDDEIARLRDKIVELERQLQAARAPSDGEPPGDLHAEIVRQQRQAEELGRIARLVNESLETPRRRVPRSALTS